MFDLREEDVLGEVASRGLARPEKLPQRRGRSFGKAGFDVVISLLLLVPLGLAALALTLLNPRLNPGSLFFAQQRMGRDCRPFTAYKFRTMRAADPGLRGAFDPLEADRIGPFGRFLRRTRIDELPQILNVLKGEMSLIGPRPDSFAHACVYLTEVPGYAARYQVIPGISGYAQTEVGYADGPAGIAAKVAADHYYLEHATLGFDLWIAWRTLQVVLGARGS